MAKKLITVEYKVINQELVKNKQVINETEQAAKKADAAVKKYGEDSARAAKQAAMSFTDLRARMLSLRDQIENTSRADKKRLQELVTQYKAVKKEVDAFNASLQSGTQKSILSLENLGKVAATVFTVQMIKRGGEAVIEMTRLTGQIQGVKNAFDKLPNSALILKELQERTHGALTDFELMQKTLQAKNFGIPLENLGKLLEFAAIKSQQTGISIQYLTDSIITGLGRESIKILDNLQIDIGKLKQRMQETGLSIREVVGDIVNEELQKMGGYLRTGEQEVNELNTAFRELKIELSKRFESSAFVDTLTDITNFFKELAMGKEETQKAMTETFATQRVREFKDSFSDLIRDQEKGINVITQEILKTKESVLGRKESIALLQAEARTLFEQHSPANIQRIDEIKAEIVQLRLKNDVEKATIPLLNELLNNTLRANQTEEERIRNLKSLKEQAELLDDAIENTNLNETKKIQNLQAQKKELDSLIKLYGDYKNALTSIEENVDPTAVFGGIVEDDFFSSISKALDDEFKRTMSKINEQNDEKLDATNQANIDEIEAEEDKQRRLLDLRKRGINMAIDLLGDFVAAKINQDNQEIDRLEGFYDNQIKLAGDNDKRREELEIQRDQVIEQKSREQAEKEKERKIKLMILETLLNSVKALGTPPVPNFPLAKITGFYGAGQVVIAKALGFKEGGWIHGQGSETSDSIPIMASKNEYMVNAKSASGAPNLLEAINSGKIDDSILNRMKVTKNGVSTSFDDSRIVKELQKGNSRSLSRDGLTLMETVEIRNNFKRRIRAKFIN